MSVQQAYSQTLVLIDSANSADPNQAIDNGNSRPKEQLYAERMTDMLLRFKPDADELQHLAARAQHIERWKTPRSNYPMDKQGYMQWRTGLYRYHADRVGELMLQSGYDADSIERVKKAVGKKGIKVNPDSQLIEDIASLVFIEHYMLDFAQQHPEYDEAKWIGIIQKTWRKMSEQGQAFALSGQLKLPEPLVPVIQKALGV
ncbi:DUF4202 domain-containing protein [Nitrincola sp. MINF-07-Sa-05]|uniref:DUF4202 domain-containing protein n=1 Tax=Nitrincola salilacus TaxID=3400273 RepID=UPI003917F936